MSDLVLALHPEIEQRVGDGVRSMVELGPGDVPIPVDQGGGVGNRVGDNLPDVGKIPIGHPYSLRFARWISPFREKSTRHDASFDGGWLNTPDPQLASWPMPDMWPRIGPAHGASGLIRSSNSS